jgi:hypothetical protein
VTRQQDTLIARQAANDWAAEHGLPPSGGYSGQWYVDAYLGGWWPDGWLKWWAIYGIVPGSVIGGDIVAHQWTSTPVDQNVLLESDIVDYSEDGGDDDMANCRAYKDALARAVDRIQIEDERKTAAGKPATIRRTVIREIASEAFQALQT